VKCLEPSGATPGTTRASACQKALWFRFGAPHVYQRARLLAKFFVFIVLVIKDLVNPAYDYLTTASYTIAQDLQHEVKVMLLRKGFFVVVFLALSVSAVNAYTVVMRDGRRVEVPNEFTVTNSTLTYEVSNGFQVTIQLNAVDIPATERANGEPTGSLLQKAGARTNVPNAPQTQARAGRSITNQDLEVYRKARVENETRRGELGLPSLEDRQREVAVIEDRTVEQVRSMRAQEEAYWRSRADALRAENEAQVEVLRQRSQETPFSYSFGAFPGFGAFDTAGFGFMDGRFNRFRRFESSPFSGFLATPITPFPTFPVNPAFRGHGRRFVFSAPGGRINARPFQMRRGSHR
jgi:hypothetical protein